MGQNKSMRDKSMGEAIDMKTHILNVAFKLLSEYGVKETSLKKISTEAGISTGTLYYHYSTKEDIIYDIADKNLNQVTDELLSWLDELEGKIPVNVLLKALFEKIINAKTRNKLHLYLISEAINNNGVLAKKFKVRYQEWRQTIRFGLDKILNESVGNKKNLSYLIVALLDGLIIQDMFSEDTVELSDLVNTIGHFSG